MMMNSLAIDEKALLGASRQELIQLAKDLVKLEQQASLVGPQTDDELHSFIKDNYKIHIPRIAVTPGHDAPFTFVADAFFQREVSQLVIANREGSKTFSVAIIQALFARFFPGYEGMTAGAIDYQTKRAYAALVKLNNIWGSDQVVDSLESKTTYKNKSIVEILTMTFAAMNGPHNWFLHRDEVELARRAAFDEADNITKSGVTTDGRTFKAHDVLTSTRKKAHGLVQELLDGVEEAEKAGRRPQYKVYKWGVAETIARVPNCRYHAAPGTPEEDLCPCNTVFKDKWDDKSDRTLEHVCAGRFGRSDGWRPLEPDIISKFLKNSRPMWEAQQECMKVASEGIILENFSKETHGIRGWDPDPENGRIFQGVDFGGTNPHAVNWYQETNRMLWCRGYAGEFKIIPAGSLVCFGEVYVTEIGNVALANLSVGKEEKWRQKHTFFEVDERYADIAQKAARLDWRTHTPPLPTVWRITREVEEHIQLCIEIVNDYMFYVDVEECEMFCNEAEAWQKDPETGKQVDEFNHCMSNFRYTVANRHRQKMAYQGRGDNDMPEAAVREDVPDLKQTPVTGPTSRDFRTELPYDPFRDLDVAEPAGRMY